MNGILNYLDLKKFIILQKFDNYFVLGKTLLFLKVNYNFY